MDDAHSLKPKVSAFRYSTLEEVKSRSGMRIVLVQGLPSAWAQAAKTILEIKNIHYIAAPWVAFDPNADVEAWSGISTAPIVVWNDEKPIHGWLEILELAERVSPLPSLIPEEAADRELMLALSTEVCGRLGLGWNRRLQIVAPAYAAADRPSTLTRFGDKHGYNERDAGSAGERIAATLTKLSERINAQRELGSEFLVGNRLSALDIYWTAFANMVAPLPEHQLAMSDQLRAMFTCVDPVVMQALDPALFRHRERIFARYFRSPMEF